MKSIFRKQQWGTSSSFCFYCGVDSTEIKLLLIGVIGGLCLASVCVGIGAYLRGHFKDTESIKHQILEIEGRE